MATTELIVLGGKHKGQTIALPIGKFLIGREEDCHLRPNSDLVSRHHCVFLVDEYGVRLRDLGSTNGTFINEERISGSRPLEAGDRVDCGGLSFEVKITEDATAEAVEPPEQPVVIDTSEASATAVSDEANAEQSASGEAVVESPTEVNSGETMYEVPQMPAMGDTQYAQPMQMPGPPPVGYPPQYQQQYPGYPQQYPGYPQQGYPQQYPGYPPQGYPQQYPGYPQQQAFQQQFAQPQAAPPEAAVQELPDEEPAEEKSGFPAMTLPDPSETGAVEPEPKPKSEGGGGGKKGNEVTDAASDIIKQYLGKR